MRIIAFLLTLFLGVYVASFFKSFEAANQTPCANSYNSGNVISKVSISPANSTYNGREIDTSRNYTLEEANALVGKQVRNRSSLNAKCPKGFGNCLELFTGETGKVVNILPSVNDSYLIEIKWDSKWNNSEDTFVTYAGKEVSFEIVK